MAVPLPLLILNHHGERGIVTWVEVGPPGSTSTAHGPTHGVVNGVVSPHPTVAKPRGREEVVHGKATIGKDIVASQGGVLSKWKDHTARRGVG